MTDTPEKRFDSSISGLRHAITGCELEKRAASARESYVKFKTQMDVVGTVEAYRNLAFDTYLRRITLLSGSEFGSVGEILSSKCGPYFKVHEAGFLNWSRPCDGESFWERNFGTGAEILHLENPLNLDFKTPRVMIGSGPDSAGTGCYVFIPGLFGSRFVGGAIVAGAPGGYTHESIAPIQPVVDSYTASIAYLRADAAAAESECAAPLKQAPALVFNCNSDDRRSINCIAGEVELITGYRGSDFAAGRAFDYASLIDPDDRERVAELIARRLKEAGAYEVEYRIVRADGKRRLVYELGTAKCDARLKQVSIDACTLDVTKARLSDRGTSEYRGRFQKLIEEQTKVFIAQRQRAQLAAKAKSEFISNISHELRTPMHAILGYSKMGVEDSGVESPEALKEYFVKIQSAGARLLTLINNLLDISQIEAGRMEFKKSSCDFSAVIRRTLSELDPLIKSKPVSVTTEITTANTEAVFDERRMMQVMVNLISNAVRFSSSGGAISIRLGDSRMRDGGEALRCSVADDGPGIPEGELEEVFGKFIQSSKTKTGAGGTGLGLAICREIVEAHGGRIWAENRKPKGVALSFTIPRSGGLAAS